MDDSAQQPSPDRLASLIETREFDAARTALDRAQTADPETRKGSVRTVREYVEDGTPVAPLLPPLIGFLDDEQRAVRLTTAKALVTVAASDPESATDAVSVLADRLADDAEFYYVRARCAEALGYVAAARPGELTPDILADLRIGLEFDEPEVREKLAKALEHVALGDPGRLSHRVSTLADHLDDEAELVRYHLTTALVVVGTADPTALADARDALIERLDDENTYVRGRALEALGLLTRADDTSLPDERIADLTKDDASFVADRARFVRAARDGGAGPEDSATEIGTRDAIRDATDEIVDDITSPDAEGECPHCGLALPDTGPPMCPQCGAPR
ncbi:HEAT repeat domain-containing protein [Halorientalis pallida]|uniref:HEAT repeat domain-containing protein n=1 Tax=Halorientalis pallida TaxID=2479928 RepID=UPI003C6FE228